MSEKNEVALETIISNAIKIPGVKVDRKKFLAEKFSNESDVQNILEVGPIQANISQEKLRNMAKKLVITRTSESSAASFAAGLPGGVAMAATIPADVLQFFGMTLRLAQELSYLYGAKDLWNDGEIDDERVRNQLILYCGAMFGVSGAAAGVRVFSAQMAKVAMKKIPQQALTKTFWYPIIKQIGKAVGVKTTKSTVAKGVSKAIPVLGGVISGGLNFASMMPMANRLQKVLEESSFDYTDAEYEADIVEITELGNNEDAEVEGDKRLIKRGTNQDDVFATIEKLAKLKDIGAITEEEFNTKKKELLDRI